MSLEVCRQDLKGVPPILQVLPWQSTVECLHMADGENILIQQQPTTSPFKI